MKYDFDHWNKTEMTQEEALAWFKSDFEPFDGKRCDPTCPQCQAEEWAIKALSVKQKKGQWRYYDGMLSCSACNSHMDDISPFCPMCGADMRG